MPTLGTMKPCRRWGTRICGLVEIFKSYNQDSGGLNLF
jgi:hypothetical protein